MHKENVMTDEKGTDNVSYLPFRCACGKVVMHENADDHSDMCLVSWERRLEMRIKRLVRLRGLNAPFRIIEAEEELIKRANTAIRNIKFVSCEEEGDFDE